MRSRILLTALAAAGLVTVNACSGGTGTTITIPKGSQPSSPYEPPSSPNAPPGSSYEAPGGSGSSSGGGSSSSGSSGGSSSGPVGACPACNDTVYDCTVDTDAGAITFSLTLATTNGVCIVQGIQGSAGAVFSCSGTITVPPGNGSQGGTSTWQSDGKGGFVTGPLRCDPHHGKGG